MRKCLCAASLVLILAGLCQAQSEPTAGEFVMPASELPAEAAGADGARACYASRLQALLPGLRSDDPQERQKAEQSLQASCWLATRPGAEIERRAVCEVLAETLKADLPPTAQSFLLEQLRMAGRAECVGAAAPYLNRGDARVRDAARRALAANPSPEAGAVLRRELEQAADESTQISLLQALHYRHDPADAPVFRRFAGAASPELRVLAWEGLACTGDPSDAQRLFDAMASSPDPLRRRAADACLRLADRLCEQGARAGARAIYRHLLAEPAPARCAALIGLGRAGGAAEIPVLFEALTADDPEMAGAARAGLALLPAADVLPAVRARLQDAPAPLLKALLPALAESRVPGILPALSAALASPDEGLRLVAVRGLGQLADPGAVPDLARVIGTAGGELAEAARDALAVMPGPAVVEALVEAFPGAPPAGRRALLTALAARPGPRTLAFLHATAEGDADPRVRQDALRALGRLAGPEDAQILLGHVLAARTEGDRDEAARALAAAARRAPDREVPARALVAALGQAPPETHGWLLRALGRIGGRTALDAVRAALAGPAPEMRDAAVRALADWPDTEAAEDLLGLARAASDPAHRVLALRGYVRAVRETPGLTPATRLAMLQEALRTASRPEERRLALGGIGEVADPAALAAALACLGEADIASEAAAAVISLAERLRWQYPRETRAALEHLTAQAPDGPERRRAADLLTDMDRYEGHLPLWLMAGPYTAEKKGRAELHGMVFPPEPGAPPAPVSWTPVRTGSAPETSWYVPLDQILGGNQRAAYLRTWVRLPSERRLRLEVGSDDGCKVWLDGELVIDTNVDRAQAPAQDVREVTLAAGWHGLLIKVVQAGGGWCAGARFCTPDGKPVYDLVTLASPEAPDLAARDVQAQGAPAAAFQAASDLAAAGAGTPAQRRRILELLAAAPDEALARPAAEALRKLEAAEDYLTAWEVAGPYERAGAEDSALLEMPFPPEEPGAPGVKWQPAPVSPGPDGVPAVDLLKLLGGEHRVAYLRARVVSPTVQPVRLELGSDDAVRVWINGKLVHSNPAARPVRPGEDQARAELRQGENVVLMKVVQYAGQWGACLRVRSPDGKHLDGVREAGP